MSFFQLLNCDDRVAGFFLFPTGLDSAEARLSVPDCHRFTQDGSLSLPVWCAWEADPFPRCSFLTSYRRGVLRLPHLFGPCGLATITGPLSDAFMELPAQVLGLCSFPV